MNTILILGFLSVPGSPLDLRAEMAQAMCTKASAGLKDMRWDRGGSRPEYRASRLERCAVLLQKAHAEGFSHAGLARVLAVAYAESNFRPGAVGSVGERGMLQVRPEKHCHLASVDGVCDFDLAGLRYLKSLVQRERQRRGPFLWARVLRHYNGSSAYARKVELFARTVLHRWRR